MEITRQALDEAKMLVSSGDIDINQLRDLYRQRTGNSCTLTEEELAAASMTEDDDDDMRMENMRSIVREGLTITEDA
jgi:hypothetical protein